MPFLTRLALSLTDFSERYVPSAFAIVGLLTFVTFGLALGLTDKGLADCVRYWGDGFWELLSFGMQMCLIMVTGAILADSPALKRGLDSLSRVPASPRQAVVWMAFLSMALCWVHWGLGMISSAFLVRRLALRHPRVDYRLLVAVAYWGMGALWHAGLSGSAPLLVATPKHFMEAKIGLIPLSDTIFSSFNLALIAVTMGGLLIMAWAVYPAREQDVFNIDKESLKAFDDSPALPAARPAATLAGWLEGSYALNLGLGAMGLAWLALDTQAKGLSLTFNKFNFFFLILGLLLYPSPRAFALAAEKAVVYIHGIIVQFPFYAGVYGIIKGAGLDMQIGRWFVSLASPETFPLVVYWYSGILNYFIPSGGSKWAVEAPYILEAAKTLGVSPAVTVLAYAWGDMATDMIQPFWCLPLLAIAKLEFKDILGYEMIAFLACTLIGSAAFLLI